MFRRISVLLLLAWALQGPVHASDTTGQSHLELRDGRPVCLPQGYEPDLFPGARWTRHETDGRPYLSATVAGEEVGYLFLTHRQTATVAYSGKPLEILVALSPQGEILLTRLMNHHEPILLVGIPEKILHDFIAQYVGHQVEDLLHANVAGTSPIALDGVSGATVTGLVADQVILTAAKLIGRHVGFITAATSARPTLSAEFEPLGWRGLIERGLLRHAGLTAAEMQGSEFTGEKDWLDLYYGVLNQPTLGRNLLGKEVYADLMADHPGRTLLIMLNDGSYSFRGSGFVRGGIFDRIQITQGMEIIRFRDSDYHYQFRVALEDAPHMGEKAIFVVPDDSFNGAEPWEMEILVTERSHETSKSKKFVHFKDQFAMPAAYVTAPLIADGGGMIGRIWSGKAPWIGLYLGLWTVVILSFAFRQRVSASRSFLKYFHLAVLAAAIFVVDLGQKGQASVVNIFTFVDVMRSGGDGALFLTEPFIFISWILIIVTTLLWGRGPFCGWLCPYGAIMEWVYEIRGWFAPKKWRRSREMPERWHQRLKHMPYGIFGLLLLVSLFSLDLAEQLAEIEPFKSTWLVGVFNRPWFLAFYWFVLLGLGVVTVRFFCRYLCPLGGALALLARFQIFKIPRRNFCTRCNICARECTTRAIDADGAIDSKVCMGCLDCINNMNAVAKCPPLIKPEIWEKYEEPVAS